MDIFFKQMNCQTGHCGICGEPKQSGTRVLAPLLRFFFAGIGLKIAQLEHFSLFHF